MGKTVKQRAEVSTAIYSLSSKETVIRTIAKVVRNDQLHALTRYSWKKSDYRGRRALFFIDDGDREFILDRRDIKGFLSWLKVIEKTKEPSRSYDPKVGPLQTVDTSTPVVTTDNKGVLLIKYRDIMHIPFEYLSQIIEDHEAIQKDDDISQLPVCSFYLPDINAKKLSSAISLIPIAKALHAPRICA
jgi:hypothetical protein